MRNKFPLAIRHQIETANIGPVDWRDVDEKTRKGSARVNLGNPWPDGLYHVDRLAPAIQFIKNLISD